MIKTKDYHLLVELDQKEVKILNVKANEVGMIEMKVENKK